MTARPKPITPYTATVDMGGAKNDVERALSIIGKRQGDKQGNTLFASITLSSKEKEYIAQLMTDALNLIMGLISDRVPSYLINGNTVSIYINNLGAYETSNIKDFEKCMKSYLVAYALNGVLSISSPELARKYDADQQRMVTAILNNVYNREAPSWGDKKMADMSGEVIMENKPVVL